MIERRIATDVREALRWQPAVALLGPRQVGKTTLAQAIGREVNAVYFDLEDPDDRDRLRQARALFDRYEDRLVILDEIHRFPELLLLLRGAIDRGRSRGRRTGRFLILGSASLDVLRETGETLAGRIAYRELLPLDVLEIPDDPGSREALFVRGGYPEAFLAPSDAASFAGRRDFIRTYLERELAWLNPRLPAETLGRLWTMLAHAQGSLLNASRLGGSLGLTVHTVNRYLGVLSDLLLVRRLAPVRANIRKRLVKSPKVYLRDSGFVHALLEAPSFDALVGHPVVGPSWEGFVIENLLAVAPDRTQAGFFRTAAGAEMDLVLDFPSGGRWAVEIKWSRVPRTTKGFHLAREALNPDRCFLVGTGPARYPVSDGVEAITLRELAAELLLAAERTGGGRGGPLGGWQPAAGGRGEVDDGNPAGRPGDGGGDPLARGARGRGGARPLRSGVVPPAFRGNRRPQITAKTVLPALR